MRIPPQAVIGGSSLSEKAIKEGLCELVIDEGSPASLKEWFTPVDSIVITSYNMTTIIEEVRHMTLRLSIRPSRDLRTHYAQLSAEAKQNPIAITVNGREDTVLVAHGQYMEQQQKIEELESRLAIYAHLAQAADDVKLGRVQPVQEAFEDVLRELRAEAK